MQSQIVLTLDAMLKFAEAYQDKQCLWMYEWEMNRATWDAIYHEIERDPFNKQTDYECTWRISFLYCNVSYMQKEAGYIRPRPYDKNLFGLPHESLLFGLPCWIASGMSNGDVRLRKARIIRPSVHYK